MSIEDLIKNGGNITINVSVADLKAFADHIVEKLRPIEEEKFVTIKEASEMLNVDHSTLWRWHRAGYLKRYDIGGRRLYRKGDIFKVLNT